MATLYLDIDDEITSAAARIRTVDDTRIAIVLPAGSRVATSRINFRLLAREAQAHNRSLAIVTPESSARALAASAGLPVFASVAEYEDAVASGPEAVASRAGHAGNRRDGVDAAAGGEPRSVATAQGTGTPGSPADVSMAAAAGGAATGVGRPSGGRSAPPEAGRSAARSGGRHTGWIVFLAFLALVLIVGGVVAYLLLPSATIVLTPRLEAVSPLTMTVRADPNVTRADPANGVVPAQRQPFPVTASRPFNGTGKKVDETKATGSVHWTNCDPTASYTIPGGATLKADNGVAFTTDNPVFLPVAILTFPGGQPVLSCQGADVTITAVKAGTAGNVDAKTINQPPPSYNANVIKVSNPAPTTGGTHTETQLVSKADVDGAVAALRKQLDQALTAALNDAVASGTDATVFPGTKTLSDISYSADPNSYVGQQLSSFTLGASAMGFATTVDEGAVRQLAADKLTSGIAAGEELVPESVTVNVGPGKVNGQAVSFPVTASASQVRRIDVAAVREKVKGLTADAARQALAPYGDARIDLSPGWAATIPTLDFRLDVRVEAVPSPSVSPSAGASAGTSSPAGGAGGSGSGGSASPGASASTASGGSPAPSPSPSAS